MTRRLTAQEKMDRAEVRRRSWRRAARQQKAVKAVVPISAQSVIATMKQLRTIVQNDWTPKFRTAAQLSPEGARFIAQGLRKTAASLVALAEELERRNPPIGALT